MGEMVEINCPACHWNIEGDLGVGKVAGMLLQKK